jgi:hypothetical protein
MEWHVSDERLFVSRLHDCYFTAVCVCVARKCVAVASAVIDARAQIEARRYACVTNRSEINVSLAPPICF